jgi:hypothetical protein
MRFYFAILISVFCFAANAKTIECNFGSRDMPLSSEKMSISLELNRAQASIDLVEYTGSLSSGTEGSGSKPTAASLTIVRKSDNKEMLRMLWQGPSDLENISTHGFTGLVYLVQSDFTENSRELQLWCTVQ